MSSKVDSIGAKVYYYVHTGHRIGLDRFRRATTIIRALGADTDITLLCSDFRIAMEAREYGVDKSVGIDVVRNIPQIAHNGDKLIFDSDEANPIMLDDMRQYFSTFIRISDDKDDVKYENEYLISPYLDGEGVCKAYAIDDKYFEQKEKSIKIGYFFGDDDYEKDLEKNLDFIDGLEAELQLGFYYFLDYEDSLKKKFITSHEFEHYDDFISKTDILITASPQAALENLASGGRPIFIQREDYTTEFTGLFESLNIPIIEKYDKKKLYITISTLDNQKYSKPELFCNTIAKFIKEKLSL